MGEESAHLHAGTVARVAVAAGHDCLGQHVTDDGVVGNLRRRLKQFEPGAEYRCRVTIDDVVGDLHIVEGGNASPAVDGAVADEGVARHQRADASVDP